MALCIHLTRPAKTLFQSRVTFIGLVSLWGSRGSLPPWLAVSGSRLVLEPRLQSDVGICSLCCCLGCQSRACVVCVGAMRLCGERLLHLGFSGLPERPVQLPRCAMLGEGGERKEPLPCPRICPQYSRPFMRRVRIPPGPFLGPLSTWVTVKVSLRPPCELSAPNP